MANHKLPDRPKAVFFQSVYPESATEFQRLHRDEHVRCLKLFFDLHVVARDADFAQLCDQIEPELAIFELGLEVAGARRPRVRNVASNRGVARLALLNSDACSEARTAVLADLETLGIGTVFSISLVAAEFLRPIADALFAWPHFINGDMFRDYGEPKSIEVLLTGSTTERYPWRKEVFEALASELPVQACRHPGYQRRKAGPQEIFGAAYARLLNASKVVPACGSVTQELVRKHLEVPAAMACLVTEESRALRAAGFVDMVHCVFATPRDVADKVRHLLANEELRRTISRNGFELVRRHHLDERRSQIYDWFQLQKDLAPGARITQPDPFGPLVAVGEPPCRPVVEIQPTNPLALTLRHADELARAGCWPAAESAYQKCLALVCEFPEAKLGMARCRLFQGDAKGALHWIVQPLRTSLVRFLATEPDPVEWATYILTLLCLGRIRAAVRRSRQFAGLRHTELDRIREVIARTLAGRAVRHAQPQDEVSARKSIHAAGPEAFPDWLDGVISALQVCGQQEIAGLVSAAYRDGASKTSLPWPYRISGQLAALPPVAARARLTGLDHPLILNAAARRLRSAVLPVERVFRAFPAAVNRRRRSDALTGQEP